MDYSHYMYLRKEIDLERMMSKEDTRFKFLDLSVIFKAGEVF